MIRETFLGEITANERSTRIFTSKLETFSNTCSTRTIQILTELALGKQHLTCKTVVYFSHSIVRGSTGNVEHITQYSYV